MRMLLILVLLGGCPGREGAHDPELGCEEALRTASQKVPDLQPPKQLAEVVSGCIGDQWPLDTRKCVAAVRDKPDFMACMMRLDERTKNAPVNHARLTVTGIDPTRGDAEGGTYVRIKGTDFMADGARNAKVYFGAHQGTVVRFASDTELVVEAPGGKPDETVDVLLILEPGGELKLPRAFTFAAHP